MSKIYEIKYGDTIQSTEKAWNRKNREEVINLIWRSFLERIFKLDEKLSPIELPTITINHTDRTISWEARFIPAKDTEEAAYSLSKLIPIPQLTIKELT